MFSEPATSAAAFKSAAPRAGAPVFPRIVKMFSLPEDEAPIPPKSKKPKRKG
jgi:hypothetical protein